MSLCISLILRLWACARRCSDEYNFVLPFNIVRMSNFELSEKLRLFVHVACNYKSLTLGVKCPVSIRKHYRFSQSIVIYPEANYDFFTSNVVMCYFSLAKGLCLDSSIDVENGLPVITISDYSIRS